MFMGPTWGQLGPTWVLSAPGGPHVGPRIFAIWVRMICPLMSPRHRHIWCWFYNVETNPCCVIVRELCKYTVLRYCTEIIGWGQLHFIFQVHWILWSYPHHWIASKVFKIIAQGCRYNVTMFSGTKEHTPIYYPNATLFDCPGFVGSFRCSLCARIKFTHELQWISNLGIRRRFSLVTSIPMKRQRLIVLLMTKSQFLVY